MTARRIAVAIHDVEPATFERCALIRDWLSDHGIDRATLLVIPAPDLHPFFQRRPDLAAWLLDCRDRGDAVAQHGFQHRRAGAPRGGGAEFAGLDADATRATIEAGRRVLSLAGVEPRGFVAPAYAYTPALRRELAGAFDWWATLLGSSAATARRSPPRSRCAARRSPSAPGRSPPAACCAWTCTRPTSTAPATCSRWSPSCAARAAATRSPTTTCVEPLRVRTGAMKLLVLTPEPVDADLLRATLGDEVEGAEVLVVSPATNQSPLAFWVSDSDQAIAEAERAEEESVERLEEAGLDAAGDTGESEPAVALQDALATFPADRILVFSHPEGDRDYREDKGLKDAEERFGVPVTHAVIGR
jgi:hypothetical protein